MKLTLPRVGDIWTRNNKLKDIIMNVTNNIQYNFAEYRILREKNYDSYYSFNDFYFRLLRLEMKRD